MLFGRGKSSEVNIIAFYQKLEKRGGSDVAHEANDLRHPILPILGYGLRQMRRSPGLTATALLIIAIGIGGTTAIFSFVDAAMLKPFLGTAADRVVVVMGAGMDGGWQQIAPRVADVQDLKSESRAFSDVALAYLFGGNVNLTGPSFEYAERVKSTQVSANYFDVLGVRPLKGRTFSPEENEPGRGAVVILSNALWRNRFGSDPEIVGKELLINGKRHDIIGILPAGQAFEAPSGDPANSRAELWLPLPFTKGSLWMQVMARLKPGVTLEQAQDDTTRVFSAHDWLRQGETPMAALTHAPTNCAHR